jgi:ATP-dependent RNA helicase DDX35
MTEGILLREMMSDPLLKCYSAIMLDEVHERTLYTDILMGLMKKIIRVGRRHQKRPKFFAVCWFQKRPEMRLIVASATMDAKELFDFFNNNHIKDKSKDSAVILSVKGRQFPVNIYYTIGRVV